MHGVIFDFNGTLFFDTPKHEAAWRKYAAELCGREISEQEFRDCVHGRTNAEILRYFLGDGLTDDELAFHAERKEELYRDLCLADKQDFHLAEGTEALLDELKRLGIPMAIATSSGKTNSDFYMKEFRLNRWFDSNTFIYNDGSFRSKPYPDIYLKAACAINVSPDDCVVFEDMPSGIKAAYNAGVGKIIAVASALERGYLAGLDGVSAVIDNYTDITENLSMILG